MKNSIATSLYIVWGVWLWSASDDSVFAQNQGILSYQNQTCTISVYRQGPEEYIAIDEVVKLISARIFRNPEKKKIVLYLPDAEIKLTAYSVFVIVNDQTAYQMAKETLWRHSSVWIPISYFLPVLNRLMKNPIQWNQEPVAVIGETKTVNETKKDTAVWVKQNDTLSGIIEISPRFNIQSLETSKKLNGFLITLGTGKIFEDTDLALWQNKQWLYLTISGGTPSPKVRDEINRLAQSGIIRKAMLFEHQHSIQFSFQLAQPIEGFELLNESENGKLHISLRLPAGAEEGKKEHQGQKKDTRWVIDKIVIDAGHGGKDPGAIGRGKTKEKDITLAIALRLGKLIEERTSVKVAYTRTTDEFISLKNRTRFANNQNAKLFISIHCNASKRRSANGFETFFLSPSRNEEAQAVAVLENEAIQYEEDRHEYGDFSNEKFILATMMQSVFVKESEELADYIQKGLAGKLSLRNRGVSQGPFYVLMGASMPSVLVEVGFISNKTEEKFLKTEAGQQAIAEGIFFGIKRFIENTR